MMKGENCRTTGGIYEESIVKSSLDNYGSVYFGRLFRRADRGNGTHLRGRFRLFYLNPEYFETGDEGDGRK